MQSKQDFALIDNASVNPSWTGTPVVLQTNDNVNMPQTTNGSMVLAYQNQSTVNNAGTLSITSGGGAPTFLNAPALANAPSILVQNWAANNLSITNISAAGTTPIWASAVGPGLSTTTPTVLPMDGTSLSLAPAAQAQGNAIPRWMQLIMQSTSATLTIFTVVGGPVDASGNNALVFALNASANTGPGTSTPAPAGYYATSTSNTISYQFNWGASTVFIANESPSTSATATVRVRPL